MKHVLFLALLSCFSLPSFAQIESGKKGEKKKKIKTTEAVSTSTKPLEDYTLLSLSYAHGSAFRLLKTNGDFYGDSLGEKSREQRLNTSAVYLGANSKLSKNLYLDFGLGFQQFGEQYEHEFTDSTVNYKTKYSTVVLPFKLHFQVGKKVIFFVNTGIQAQLLAGYSNEYTVKKGSAETTTETHLLKFKNTFSLASTSSLGIQFPFSPKTCLIVSGDYIQQVSSTFNKQAPYIHKSNFYGFKIGLGFKI